MTNSPIPQNSRFSGSQFVLLAALVIAFGIMGDSLMYSLLPLEAPALGISMFQVGLLLSANRIFRLVSNFWASLAFERWGAKFPFALSAVLGLVSTLLYGGMWGFWVFLLARAVWGVAWSGFRQGGYQAVWGASEARKGRLMGVLWGIVRLGSAFSVLAGGYVYDKYGYLQALTLIAMVSALSIPIALLIPWQAKLPQAGGKRRSSGMESWSSAFKTPSRRWLLASGFMDTLFEGALVSTASIFLQQRFSGQTTLLGIGTLAGILLAVRFVANIIFAPLLGDLSDRIGQPRMLLALTTGMLAAMAAALTFSGIWALAAMAVVFFCGSGSFAALNAAASGLAQHTNHPHRFVGIFTTAIDAGAAAGPLLAFSLVDFSGFGSLYLGSLAVLMISAVKFYIAQSNSVEKI